MKRFWKPALGIAVLLCLWDLAARAGVWNEYVLPSPQKVFHTFWKLSTDGSLLRDIAVSCRRVGVGFAIAFALAFSAGLANAFAPGIEAFYAPFLEFMRNVPPIALIALLILWFGIGEASKIIIIVLASFFPMLLNIRKGFAGTDPKWTDVGRAFGYTRAGRFWHITLPSAVPDILVGMRVGLGYAWRAIIGAEMFAASTGLGHMIVYAQQMSRSDRVLIGIFAIGLVGLLCDGLFRRIVRRIPWGGMKDASIARGGSGQALPARGKTVDGA